MLMLGPDAFDQQGPSHTLCEGPLHTEYKSHFCLVTSNPDIFPTLPHSLSCSGTNYQHGPVATANCTIPLKNGTLVTASCFNAASPPMCTRNGDVVLPFGSAPYIGMGLMVRRG